jgi:hypothetical protein
MTQTQTQTQTQTKSERMEIRRAIGNRDVVEPYAPPYHRGPDYLIAHACFGCRKSWKIEPRVGSEPKCPQCGNPVNEMGRAFKAPKKSDAEQWKKVEALWRAGFRFWSVWSSDVEPLPDRLRDVDDFVRRNPDHPARLSR